MVLVGISAATRMSSTCPTCGSPDTDYHPTGGIPRLSSYDESLQLRCDDPFHGESRRSLMEAKIIRGC